MPRPREIASAIGLAVRNANVRRAELAWGGAIGAEWAHFVALGVFAYRSGGASAVGFAGLVRLLPAAVVAPVAAAVGDRFRRDRFFLAVMLLGTAALAGSAIAASADARVTVYACAAVVGVATTLVRPTLAALLPTLARTPDELIAANGASLTIESFATLGGPLLAAVLVATVPIAVVFAVAAAILAGGAVLITRVQVERRPPSSRSGRVRAPRPLRSGWEATARAPGTRLVLGLMVAQTFVRGCLNVLIVVAAFQLLHAGAGGVGYLTSAVGVGGLVGALWAMALPRGRLASAFALSLVLWGLPIALMAPPFGLAAALVLLAIVGAANSTEDVAALTLVQRLLPHDALYGVLAILWGMAMGAVAVGSIVAPGIVTAIGARPSFLVVGSLLPLVVAASYRALTKLDRLAPPREDFHVVDRVPMFRPLSLATKEQLAAGLIPVSVRPDETVVSAGERGDRFYIVGSGELDVDVDGRHRKLSAGDSFGEIALLRDVPRTATVTAIQASQLYALGRDDFLAAVTGHPAAESAARAVADAHLARSQEPRSDIPGRHNHER